jgi:hypothetical protein
MAAKLAADFQAGDIAGVAAALNAMDCPDAAAVALFVGGFLSPAKRALLVDTVLGG